MVVIAKTRIFYIVYWIILKRIDQNAKKYWLNNNFQKLREQKRLYEWLKEWTNEQMNECKNSMNAANST